MTNRSYYDLSCHSDGNPRSLRVLFSFFFNIKPPKLLAVDLHGFTSSHYYLEDTILLCHVTNDAQLHEERSNNRGATSKMTAYFCHPLCCNRIKYYIMRMRRYITLKETSFVECH